MCRPAHTEEIDMGQICLQMTHRDYCNDPASNQQFFSRFQLHVLDMIYCGLNVWSQNDRWLDLVTTQAEHISMNHMNVSNPY